MTTRVLFVCCGNTCRSVIAEYISRKRFSHRLVPASAGLEPQSADDTRHALDAIREYGIDVPCRHEPKHVRYVNLDSFDLIITMDKEVFESFREICAPVDKIERWEISDPWDTPTEYRTCIEKISTKIESLVERLENAKWKDEEA